MSIIGASAVLKYGDKYVFEIQKPHKWEHIQASVEIGIGCIGGKIEGQETPLEALSRETQEEVGSAIKVLKWQEPFYITKEFVIYDKDKQSDGVFFYWQSSYKGYEQSKVCVFLGEVLQEPKPVDLPGHFLIADMGLMMECVIHEVTLSQALDKGVMLKAKQEIPSEAILKPVGTTQMLKEMYLSDGDRLQHLL